MNALVKQFAMVLGVVLLLVGVVGFFTGDMLIIFQVSPLHNVVHILSGVVGLAAAGMGASYARLYLIVFGIVYALVTVIGFVNGGDILGLFAVNTADNYLHAAIALSSLGIGFGSSSK
jgi:hypothetical protein